MPIEVAYPDKILVEDMDTTFYIVINDEEIKENVVQLELTFFNEREQKITIPYHGENVVEVPFHIPSRTSSRWIWISIEWFYANYIQSGFENGKPIKEKILSHYFRYHHEFNLYNKIPTSILPAIIANEKMEEGKDSFGLYQTKVNMQIPNRPGARFSFWVTKNLSKDNDYFDHIKTVREEFKDLISLNLNSSTCENTYNMIKDETESSDPYIDNIIYDIWCGYQCNNNYQCAARIIAKQKHEPYFKDNKDKTTYYDFYVRFNDNINIYDTVTAESKWNKFISEMELFAKNIVLTTPPNMEYEEWDKHSFSSGQLKWTEYDSSYKNESHSSIYNQIMAWEKPKIETPKKKTNIAKRKFVVKFRYEPKKNIRNTGMMDADIEYATIWFSIDIQWKAWDKDGKEITDVSDEDLFADSRLICLNELKDSQLWFRQWSNMVKKIEQKIDSHTMSCDIYSKWPRNYEWPWKKIEAVSIYVASGEYQVSNQITHIINVDDMTPDIELEKNPKKIQDDAEGIFNFKIISEVHKWMECKIKIPYERYAKHHIPVLKISQEWKWDENLKHYLRFPCEANKDIPIRIKPPSMGNFDVLWELNKLSMVALQEGTAVTFVGDLVGVWVEDKLNKLKAATKSYKNVWQAGYKKVKVIEKLTKNKKALDTLNKANDAAGYAQDAMKGTQIDKTIEWHVKDTKEAFDKEDTGIQNKSTLEDVADLWVWGINGLQTAVGAVVMAPKYIPIIWKSAVGKFITKKVGAKFILAFNLMTNVWKWNLQYISKSEKIDRAEEKKLPIPIIIEVETKEGFIVQDIQIINVLYTWLEK